ncbi:MAG: Holliday junction resolvase RuvX [Actinomycetes bacterium]
MRTGVRIGIDVGTVRVGVARSDSTGMLAVPVATVRQGAAAIAEVAAIAAEFEALEVLVGHPINMSGKSGKSAIMAQQFAADLAAVVDPVPVRMVDERNTTTQAHRHLQASGISTRNGRSVIDQVAAVIIVQHALDAERISGTPLGTIVRAT